MQKTNLFWFERKNDDFPFYKSEPPIITLGKGIFLFLAIILGFLIFVGVPFIPEWLRPFINVIFPLGAFYIVVGKQWTQLFRKVVPMDILIVLGTLLVNIIVTFIMAQVVVNLFGGQANPAAEGMAGASPLNTLLFFASTIPMLIGEELITIIPFLLIMQVLFKALKLSRKTSVIIAWVLVSLFFGALHLPTYGWNIGQALLGISVARIILLFPYIKTKNMWLTIAVHILNDWFIFGIGLLL